MPFDTLAFDAGARSYDQDGRLHVQFSHISKACVNPYRGNEIPGADALGLDPGRVYQLLRDPEELARSAPTWNGLPLLIKHTPLTANDHDRDVVVGALGGDAAFRAPYLDNSLTVWDGQAIAGIESGQQRQLSGGYHYKADMTPGVWNGVNYDGVMREIRGNHVALVETGRAGNDVMVMDAAMDASLKGKNMVRQVAPISLRTGMAMGALHAYLPHKLAADAKLPDLKRLLRSARSNKEIKARVTTAITPLLATDASLSDLDSLIDHLQGGGGEEAGPAMIPEGGEQISENPPDTGLGDPEGTNEEMLSEDDDLEDKVRELLAGKLDDADLEMLLKLIRPDDSDVPIPPPEDMPAEAPPADVPPPEEPPPAKEADAPEIHVHAHTGEKDDDDAKDNFVPSPSGLDRRRRGRDAMPPALEENQVDKPAMDAAIKAASQLAVAEAVKQTTARLNARAQAERFVRPWIGEVTVAMDSAEDVLSFALKALNVPAKGITTVDGMKSLLALVPKAGEERPRTMRMAADAASVADFATRFPGASRIRVVG
jgi:hypothetical protein